MRAILTFNLPKEQHEFDQATKAGAYASAIFTLANELRSRTKYAEKPDESLESFKDFFWLLMEEYGIDPYED